MPLTVTGTSTDLPSNENVSFVAAVGLGPHQPSAETVTALSSLRRFGHPRQIDRLAACRACR